MRRLRWVAGFWLWAMLWAYAWADANSGTVGQPSAKTLGAYRATFTAAVKSRDVFQIKRGAEVLGEAIAVGNEQQFVLLMPKAGFKGSMQTGDTAVFVRHATEVSAIPVPGGGGQQVYRAFDKRTRISLVLPVPSDDLIYDTKGGRVQFQLATGGVMWLMVRNTSASSMIIDWKNVQGVDVTGKAFQALPAELALQGSLRSIISPQTQMQDTLVAFDFNRGRVTLRSLLGAYKAEELDGKSFQLTIPFQVGGVEQKITFMFALSVVKTESFLGLSWRPTTETEIDNLPRPYRFGVVVTYVVPSSPAWTAGFHIGDTVMALDKEPVASSSGLNELVNAHHAGDHLLFTIVRDGATKQLTAVLAATH